MEAERDRKIRARAYELWEQGGRKEGHSETHWRQASEEFAAGSEGPDLETKSAKPSKARAAKPAEAEAVSSKPAASKMAAKPAAAKPAKALPKAAVTKKPAASPRAGAKT